MAYKLGVPLDYDPFEDEDESTIDSPADPDSNSRFKLGEPLDYDPFEGEDPYENDPKSSDIDEPDEGGHSLWDIPRLMGKGAAGLAKTASFFNSITNQGEIGAKMIGAIGDLTDNETMKSYRDFSDKHGTSAKLKEYGDEAERYYDEKLTPAMKRSMEKTILASGDEEGFFGPGAKDPWKIAGLIAESIPSTIISMGGSMIITKGLIQTGLKSAPKIVQGVIDKMVKKYGVNAVAGVIGGAAGEGGYSGLENASQAYQEIMDLPQDELIKSRAYDELYNSMPDKLSNEQKHAYARKALAMATGAFVGLPTALTTGLFGAPSGAFMGKLIGGEGGKSLWGNLLKGAISEGFFEEMPQSGMERLISNISKKLLVDENQELLEGTGEAMASGAVAGFAMGFGMAGVAGRVGKESAAKDLLTDGSDTTAADILLGEDEAKKVRDRTKGKKFGGSESIDAEEEAGEHVPEDIDELAEKPKPKPKPKPKTTPKPTPKPAPKAEPKPEPAPEPKLTPAPESDRREGQRETADRREEPERPPPAWDKNFRTIYLNSKKLDEQTFVKSGKMLLAGRSPTATGLLDIAKRLGETIEPDTNVDEALKTIHGRIKAGMEPRKKASEMSEDELREAANTDYLTGLRNKQAFDIEDTRKKHLASIDLDSLKYINDTFGHQAGDAMLINFGNALRQITDADTYHVSGDEFIVQSDDDSRLTEILHKRIVSHLNKNPLTVITPDGKEIQYEVQFSYGKATTTSAAETELQKHKAAREAGGQRSGRGEIPPGLPGGPAKRKPLKTGRQGIPKKGVGRTFKHFTTPYRAGRIQDEGFKPGAEKPLFGTGGLDKGEKTGRFAGDAIYLSLNDKAWGTLNTFEASGPAIKATGKEAQADYNIYYDYDAQAWMAEPGAYKKTPLTGVEFELPPDTRVLRIDSIEAYRKAAAKYGHFSEPSFWLNIAKDYDAVGITNVASVLSKSPDNEFFKSAMADQLIVLNRGKATVKKAPIKKLVGGGRRAPMRTTPPDTDSAAKIKKELEGVDTDPSKKQQKAGNYSKGHFKVMGFNVTIENPAGEERSGTGADGKEWTQTMHNHYGYFARTEGKDGDEVDLFMGEDFETDRIFIIHQVDPKTRKPDEDKVMLGFSTAADAIDAYHANYKKGWQGFDQMTTMDRAKFADWLDKQTKARAAKKLEHTVQGTLIKAITGKRVNIVTPGNKRGYLAHYAVVDADALVPSHNARTFQKNPKYPAGIQERTYDTDPAEQEKVRLNAAHLNPDIVLSDDPTPTNGPPIITATGIVLGGNSRAMSLQLAYAAPLKAKNYKEALKDKPLIKYGIMPGNFSDVKKPVLVRMVYLDEVNTSVLHRMASEFNKTLTQGVSQEAEIASMGKNISMETIEKIGLRMSNRDLTLRELLGKKDGIEILHWLIGDDVVSVGDQSKFVSQKVGLLNDTGKALIEKALLGSIIDDADLLSAAPKGLLNKIGRLLPSLAKVKARGGRWDITPDVKDALQLATQAKGADSSIREFLKQRTLFGDQKRYGVIAQTLGNLLIKENQSQLSKRFKAFASDAMADSKDQTFMFAPRTFVESMGEHFGLAALEDTPRPPERKPVPPEMLTPGEYVKQIADQSRKTGKPSGIPHEKKFKVDETGDTITQEADAAEYLNELEDEIAGYEELLNCLTGGK